MVYLWNNVPNFFIDTKIGIELEELLHSSNAIDLLDIFKKEGINEYHLIEFDIDDFKNIGISDLRAGQLYRDIQKEHERKISLLQTLKDVNCEEIYDQLVKIGYTSKEVFSTKHEDLKDIGISSYPERKEILKKIQISRATMINGNQMSSIFN